MYFLVNFDFCKVHTCLLKNNKTVESHKFEVLGTGDFISNNGKFEF